MNSSSPQNGKSTHRWREWLFLLSLCVIVGAWGGSALRGALTGGDTQSAMVSACSGATLLFPRIQKGSLQQWIDQYHGTVRTVVDDTMLKVQTPDCSASRRDDVPGSVRELASKLPPWQQTHGSNVALADTPAVLLEHLRVYECTLREWDTFLPTTVGGELTNGNVVVAPLMAISRFFAIPAGMSQYLSDHWKITQELLTSRRALHRTLLVMSSASRFTPLTQSMDCLQRVSVDLRNVLGLAAETSACMPRVWDARSALRNLAPDP